MKSQGKPERGETPEVESKARGPMHEPHRTTAPQSPRRASADTSKHTQTHIKAIKRFEDLLLNGQFLARLWDISVEKNPKKRGTRLHKFAERYALDLYVNSPFRQLINAQHPDTSDTDFGYCHVVDEAMEILENPDNNYYEASPALNPAQRHRFILYPVHIALSPLATKREVLDYVAKRWPEIRGLLDTYRKKVPRLRERPQALRDQFIWDNRNLRRSQLADMVNAKFPGELQTYSTVQTIVQRLRVRHKEWPHFD